MIVKPGYHVLLRFTDPGITPLPDAVTHAAMPWETGGEALWARVQERDPEGIGDWIGKTLNDPMTIHYPRCGSSVRFKVRDVLEVKTSGRLLFARLKSAWVSLVGGR